MPTPRKYVYAECYGEVYRFTLKNWEKMLRVVSNGDSVDYDEYAASVCVISHNITDLDDKRADELLADIEMTKEYNAK